jgi:Phage tail lysozyme
MDDVEYILRIILRARDEMAAVLAKARTQLRGFASDADKMNLSVEKLNKSMGDFNKNMDGVAKKLEAWRAVLRDSGDDSDKAAKSLDNFGKSAESTVARTKRAATTVAQLRKESADLNNQYKELIKSEQLGTVTTDYAAKKYKELAQQLDAVGKKFNTTTRDSQRVFEWARNAEQSSKRILDAKKAEADGIKKLEAEILAAQRQSEREEERRNAALARAAAQRAAADKKELDKKVAQLETIQRLVKQRAELDKLVLAGGGGIDREQTARLAQDFEKLSKSFHGGTEEAKHWAQQATNVRANLSALDSDVRRADGSVNRLGQSLGHAGQSARGMGSSVAALDNRLRGLGLLAAVASAQQLISAAIALGGELVSLAGSAVMAGGALGGILAAGAAQALPVFGLLAGAMQRVKSVFDAFQQSQKLQQATFTDAEKKGQKQIDYTNRLANAQDAQAAAQDNLAQSRKALTQAQEDGARQLEDLIFQEKAAALAAKGASLNVKEAQKALRDAVAGGASALEIQQRQQALDEARQNAGRARTTATRATEDRQAAGGKVGNLEPVKNAAKQVQDAERALGRANRSLDQAADKTDRAGSSTMTAAANLNFLLSQLSPAERKLYEALNRTYETYRKIFQGTGTKGSGIYGVIIDSFTRAVDEVNKIMQNPEIMKTVQGLANSIGGALNKITDSFTGPKSLGQLQTIIGDASKNIGPLSDILTDLAHTFLNIAETANPAFQDLIKYVRPLVERFLALTEDKGKMEDFFSSGEKHLQAWLDLVVAIIRLFAALTGASAGEGKKSVEDLTKLIDGWTDKLQANGDKVRDFFKKARVGAFEILGVLENLAKTLFGSFDPKSLSNFTDVLNKSVIPALGTVIETMGKFTGFFSKIVDSPLGAELVKWGVALLFFGQVASSSLGVLKLIVGYTGAAKRGIKELGDVVKATSRFFGDFAKNLKLAIELSKDMDGRMKILGRTILTVFLGDNPFVWIIVGIAAVIAGVILLLNHFGKLDDVWRGLKDAANIFLEAVQPAIKSLQDALKDLGIHVDNFKDVLKGLEAVGKVLADFITVVLVESFKGLAHVIAGVVITIVRTLTGLIKIIKGVVDIVLGFWKAISTGNTDQLLRGLEELAEGVADIFAGIVEGIVQAFEGMVDIFLMPFKAAWAAVKDFFGVSSPSKLAKDLGHWIVQGIKDGLKTLASIFTAPFRVAWKAVNDFFGGKPQELAEWIMREFVAHLRVLWHRVRAAATFIWEKFKDGFDAAKRFGATIINAIVDGIKALPGALLKAIENIGGDLLNIGKKIGGFLVDGIKSAVGAVGHFFGIGGDDDKKKAAAPTPQRQASAADVNQAFGVVPFGAKDLQDAKNIYGEFWKELRRAASTSTDFIQRQFREMRISTSESSDKMYRDIRGSVADIQNSFNVRGKVIVETWSDNWFSLMSVTNDGLNYIGHQTNLALKALGEKHINFGLTEPKKADKRQRGGMIPGSGDGDKVHVLAEPGEGFINKRAVKALGGPGVINAINSFIPRFQEGGVVAPQFAPIPGMPGEEANTRVIPLIVKLIARYHAFVTDAYDRDHSAGHKSPGHNVTGTAVDMVPKNPTAAGWNMIEAMGKWAVSKGMIVGYGAGVPGSQAWPGHGRGNHIHIELGNNPGAAASVLVETMAKIGRPIVTGAKVMASISQAAINKMLRAANAKLAETFAATQGGATDFKVGKVGAGAEPVFKFFRQHGFTDEQAAAWVGNFTQESGLNPAAIQPNGEGHGLAQWGGGRFAALQNFAAQHKKPWTDRGLQLAFVMYELGGPEASAMRAIKASKTVEQATNAIGTSYERYGIQGDRSGPARAAFAKFAGKFAEGGIIPGGDGVPVNILAHAGEWVLNKGQQLRAAMLSGLSVPGLRALLGFHGGPDHFQGGGEIRTRLGRAPVPSAVHAADRALARGLDTYQEMLFQVSQTWAKIGEQSAIALAKGKKRAGNYQTIIDQIDRLTADKGTLETLATAISDQLTLAEVKLKAATFKVKSGVVIKALGDTTIAGRELSNIVANYKDLIGERGIIHDAIAKVNTEIKRIAKDKTLSESTRNRKLQELKGQHVTLVNDLNDVDSKIADATEARFQAQIAVQQAFVDEINKRHETVGKGLDLAKRMAAAIGDQGALGKINNGIAANMAAQANELEARIKTARAHGATELADQLQDQVNDLRVQIYEAAQQAIQDSVDAVNQAASRRLGRLDLFGRMADALGVVGNAMGVTVGGETLSRSGVFAARGDALTQQRTGLQGALGQAATAGNMKLVQDLTDQLAELDVTIAENSKAQFDARVQEVTNTHDYTESMLDLQLQLNDLNGAVNGQVDLTEKANLLTQKSLDLTAKGNELTALLAETTPGSQQYNDLQKAILENKIALVQNTTALNEVTGQGSAPASYTSTAWQWFRQAFLTGTGGVMPQYALPPNASMTSGGLGGSVSMASSTTNNGSQITNNFEINEAGQPIDTTKLASTVVFAQSTAP